MLMDNLRHMLYVSQSSPTNLYLLLRAKIQLSQNAESLQIVCQSINMV